MEAESPPLLCQVSRRAKPFNNCLNSDKRGGREKVLMYEVKQVESHSTNTIRPQALKPGKALMYGWFDTCSGRIKDGAKGRDAIATTNKTMATTNKTVHSHYQQDHT